MSDFLRCPTETRCDLFPHQEKQRLWKASLNGPARPQPAPYMENDSDLELSAICSILLGQGKLMQCRFYYHLTLLLKNCFVFCCSFFVIYVDFIVPTFCIVMSIKCRIVVRQIIACHRFFCRRGSQFDLTGHSKLLKSFKLMYVCIPPSWQWRQLYR